MKNEYRREMERLGPSQEELERLYTMIEGGTLMNRKKRLGCRAAAILVCTIVMMITVAVAAGPTVWETLTTHLGAFAPYAQTIKGAVCTDQGVELQVLSALSDDLEAWVYLSARDVKQDRLNQYLTLTGRLTVGEEVQPDAACYFGNTSTGRFELVSYDPETKTALLSARISYGEAARPTCEAQLSITGMTTQKGTMYGNLSCASVTGAVLDSRPAAEGDRIIHRPSDIANATYTNAVLPSQHVVLAPGQTPMALEGTEDMWVSSIGFASDGCFHIRLGFAEGVTPLRPDSDDTFFMCDLWHSGEHDGRMYTFQETLVEDGLDILFPLITPEDLDMLQSCEVRFYGDYTRPGTDIQGDWSARFQLEYYPSVTLDWSGTLSNWQVRQVTVSPLSVTMHSNASGGAHEIPLYAVKKDGSTVAAEPGTGRYSNRQLNNGESTYDAFNTWKFQEPVDVEDIAFLALGDERIPVNGTVA